MTSNKIKESRDEYQIQHFSISCEDFVAQFKQNFEDHIDDLYKDLEEPIGRHLNLDDEKKEILHQEIKKLTEIQKERVGECLDEIKTVAEEFFTIPEYIVLKTDEIHENTNEETIEAILEDIKRLEDDYKKKKLLYEHDLAEIKYLDDFEPLKMLQEIIDTDLTNSKTKKNILAMNSKISKMSTIINDLPKLGTRNN